MIETTLLTFGIICGLMLLLWLASLVLRDASIVDPFWGVGFVVIAAVSYYSAGNHTIRNMLLLALVGGWGVRLAGYLTWRKIGEAEDHRYRKMRENLGGKFWWVSLFVVFLLQAVIMVIVALPVQVGMLQTATLNWLGFAGILLWTVGVVFESVGDIQLARFKANPENDGKVLDRGLWRYTRHPNYFGDFLVWWGIYCVSFGDGRAWWSVVGPIVMSVLLMRISGVTLLEKSLRSTKQGYNEYVLRTNAFFPWLPKQPTVKTEKTVATREPN